MAIKVTTNDVSEKVEKPFPKLMQGTCGTVFLMTDEGRGTVVCGDRLDIGRYANEWHSGPYTDYNGSVTLQNED